jgi:hypothetical protein
VIAASSLLSSSKSLIVVHNLNILKVIKVKLNNLEYLLIMKKCGC